MIYRRLYDWPTSGPVDGLEQMRRNMERLFSQLYGGSPPGPSAGVFPLINLTESKDGYNVRAELPGVKSDELEIQATAKTVSISGERKIDPEKNDIRYHRKERDGGKFSRIITLPGEINPDKVEARLANGILNLAIPKAEKSKPKQISVK